MGFTDDYNVDGDLAPGPYYRTSLGFIPDREDLLDEIMPWRVHWREVTDELERTGRLPGARRFAPRDVDEEPL